MSDDADNTARKQRGRPFEAGQSGNPGGRPLGARNKLSNAFLEAVFKDFQKASEEDATLGEQAIAKMRAEKPNEYARMIASLLAKEVDANINGDLSEEVKQWLGIG